MTKSRVREITFNILLRIEKDQSYSHLLIDQAIQKNELIRKDARLLTEIVYGTVQRQMTLDYFINSFIRKNQTIDHWVRVLLRMSIYQMTYLDRVPSYAVIHEAVEIAKAHGHRGIGSFVNGLLRSVQRQGIPDLNEIKDKTKRLSIATSHPLWLVNRWVQMYGFALTEKMCHANLKQKQISVRVQPLKITREKAIEQLKKCNIRARESLFSNQGIVIEEGNVLQTDLFKEGYITIQDETSMLVSEMLTVKPKMHVLDTCSAPGGKVTHIAELMNNEGKIHAYDLHQRKLNIVDQRQKQLDLSIIKTKQGDARNLREKYEENSFDRILIDAPCSGLGVVQSKPDIKYSKQQEDIERLAEIQLNMLKEVAPLLKEEGRLIYSTCTVDREENENVIKNFLHITDEFVVDQQFFTELPIFLQQSPGMSKWGLQIFPHSFQTDGFFLTRIKRK